MLTHLHIISLSPSSLYNPFLCRLLRQIAPLYPKTISSQLYSHFCLWFPSQSVIQIPFSLICYSHCLYATCACLLTSLWITSLYFRPSAFCVWLLYCTDYCTDYCSVWAQLLLISQFINAMVSSRIPQQGSIWYKHVAHSLQAITN